MSFPNLAKRLFFALWAAPAAWIIVNASISLVPSQVAARALRMPELMVYPGQAVCMVLVFMAAAEYFRMLSIRFTSNGFWLAHIWLGMQLATYFLPQFSLSIRFDKDIYVLLLLVAIEAAIWGKSTERWQRASLLFSGVVFVSTAGFSLLGFYQTPFQKIFPIQLEPMMLSQMGIMTVLAGVFFCDTAAYFVGSAIGRHHFSLVSPKKTVEGAVAGLVVAIVISTIGWYFFADIRYPRYLGIVMGVLVGVFAQAGDLLVSLMKRYFSVKDASNIIPGHGGILDRFDSLFFTAPILSVFFVLVDRIWG